MGCVLVNKNKGLVGHSGDNFEKRDAPTVDITFSHIHIYFMYECLKL